MLFEEQQNANRTFVFFDSRLFCSCPPISIKASEASMYLKTTSKLLAREVGQIP